MRSVIKNLISIIRRFKVASVLNILGLSVALAAFIIIMMQVVFDRTYDTSYPNSDCICLVESEFEGCVYGLSSDNAFQVLTASSSHIKESVLLQPNFFGGKDVFSVDEGKTFDFSEIHTIATNGLASVFGMEAVEGNLCVKENSFSAIIPETMAKRMFGEESSIGKTLVMKGDSANINYTITGVYKDIPSNCSLENAVYTFEKSPFVENWGMNFLGYVLFDNPESINEVDSVFNNSQQWKDITNELGMDSYRMYLKPIGQIHFDEPIQFDFMKRANKSMVNVLFAVAFVLLVIAGINYLNYSVAMTPVRIKSINLQKVYGNSNSVLRISLILEAVLVCIFAFALALLLVFLFSKSPLASLLEADMRFSNHKTLIFSAALLSVLLGTLAGLYPAFYMTSFAPAFVLEGNFGLSKSGKMLRNVLLTVQFVASFVLIITAVFMFRQNNYMMKTDLGFQHDVLITAKTNSTINQKEEAFVNQLKANHAIVDVANSLFLLSGTDNFPTNGNVYHGKQIIFNYLPIDINYLEVMGIEITEGRNFMESDKGSYSLIFNEKARKQFDLQLNDDLNGGKIIGFVSDVKFMSLRNSVEPMAFGVYGLTGIDSKGPYYIIRVREGSDLFAAMDFVKQTLNDFDPGYQFDVRFYDDVINGMYEKEMRLNKQITLFSIIAILISIAGVFGLVIFDSAYRRKEIAVRKVFGSTTNQIFTLFNKTYMGVVVISFAIAVPVAVLILKKWLENFAYHIGLSWWVFVLAFVGVSLVTIATVTFQNYRAANMNPAEALKKE